MLPPVPHIPETAPFSAEQRAWLNGFLAGLFSHAPRDSQVPSPRAPGEPLLILFGSQTGTAENLARTFARESAAHGFEARVHPLNDYAQANLAAGGKALIISSTWGDGEPPENATSFWHWLNSDSVPPLDRLQFAVLGLGDRNYSEFCGAAKKFDARLEALGARRLATRGECDVDYEPVAKAWMEGLWPKLANGTGATTVPSFPVGQPETARAPLGISPARHSKSNPYPARLLHNVLLSKPGSAKEVRHYEIALDGSGLAYEAGDALGIVPVNCPELVEDILAAVRASPGEKVKLGEEILSLGEALTHRLEISKPSRELLHAVAQASPESDLAGLLAPEREEDLRRWLWGRHVVDLLLSLPRPLAASELVPLLKPLAPRLYSISSSPRAHPDQAHLTVGVVRYESHGRPRKGVASTFLADRVGDAEVVKIYVQPSPGFKPPADNDAPMIMVGPGTGVAPFRAFLEDRQATGARGRNWLFYGDQRRQTDFLYEEELTAWQKSGLLTHLDLAFSRDQAQKVYVQDRLLEQAAEVWRWLQAGAHFYVCGDARRMAKDVDAALHRIVETQGARTPEEAKDYVARLKSEKRYQRDVY